MGKTKKALKKIEELIVLIEKLEVLAIKIASLIGVIEILIKMLAG